MPVKPTANNNDNKPTVLSPPRISHTVRCQKLGFSRVSKVNIVRVRIRVSVRISISIRFKDVNSREFNFSIRE